MSVAIPHFAFPFLIVNGSVVVNEQDSTDDVLACVALIASFPIGSRVEKPAFGVPDQTFAQGGADAAVVAAAINRWEPRAVVSSVTVELGAAAQ